MFTKTGGGRRGRGDESSRAFSTELSVFAKQLKTGSFIVLLCSSSGDSYLSFAGKTSASGLVREQVRIISPRSTVRLLPAFATPPMEKQMQNRNFHQGGPPPSPLYAAFNDAWNYIDKDINYDLDIIRREFPWNLALNCFFGDLRRFLTFIKILTAWIVPGFVKRKGEEKYRREKEKILRRKRMWILTNQWRILNNNCSGYITINKY